MAFHEVRFPLNVSFGSSVGLGRKTQIVTLASGFEERNTPWQDSRRRYDAGYGLRSLDDLHRVVEFFEGRRGRLHGFRLRDPVDWKSCAPLQKPAAQDQELGEGDGVKNTFALKKTYDKDTSAYTRPIRKPVAGTVLVAVAGTAKVVDVDFEVDSATGVITFKEGFVPQAGQKVTAGFTFDVPVRFDTDTLDINLAVFKAGEVPSIPIVELRLP